MLGSKKGNLEEAALQIPPSSVQIRDLKLNTHLGM